LFVSYVTDFEALGEDAREYQELLNGLWDQYQPSGRAEEIEVERIALCYWKLKRAWRYENAANLAARRDFVRAELAYQEEYCKEKDKEEDALLVELQNAKKEIEGKGEVSPELKQRMFGMMPGFQALWLYLEKAAQARMDEPDMSKISLRLTPKGRARARDLYSVINAIALYEQLSHQRSTNVRETAIGRYAIPNAEALDRLLRYETTIERSLNRALERIERLQRRRKGEPLLPPVSGRLTQ
jgi:hypothetical protein